MKAVIAAPPPGSARSTESSPAVARIATPAPCRPRAGRSACCEVAIATRTDPSRSATEPVTAVHFGPTRSTSQAAGRFVTSRPAKKTENTSPAPVALRPSVSWIAGRAGETISTHQYVKKSTAREMRSGNAELVAIASVRRPEVSTGACSALAMLEPLTCRSAPTHRPTGAEHTRLVRSPLLAARTVLCFEA